VAEAAQQMSSNVSLVISPLLPWDRPPQDIEDQHIPGEDEVHSSASRCTLRLWVKSLLDPSETFATVGYQADK
jgi:hypothetical protein